jgi:hypothetical protein
MKWTCDYCRFENQVKSPGIFDLKLIVCENCGLGFPVERVKTLIGFIRPNSEIWDCYPIEDLATRIPKSINGEFYKDPIGNTFTRLDYIKIHKIDPKIYLEYKEREIKNINRSTR